MLDALLEHGDNALVQQTYLCKSERMSATQRMNTCMEQRLIGIDIAHPRHNILIEQHLLDATLAPRQSFCQMFYRERFTERLQSQRCENLLLTISRPQLDAPKFARISEKQTPPIHKMKANTAIMQCGVGFRTNE